MATAAALTGEAPISFLFLRGLEYVPNGRLKQRRPLTNIAPFYLLLTTLNVSPCYLECNDLSRGRSSSVITIRASS